MLNVPNLNSLRLKKMSTQPIRPSTDDCTNCKPNPRHLQRIEDDQPSSNIGKLITLGIGATAIGLVCVTIPFVLPAMRKHALPYIPATDKQVSNAFKAIRIFNKSRPDSKIIPETNNIVKLIDIGSGDGRIVFEAAKHGYNSTGVELNSMLVLFSKLKALRSWSAIKKEPYIQNAPLYYPRFIRADLWKTDMSEYDLIVVFGVQEMMADLASKLKKEMKPNCLIVSCRSPIVEYKSIYHLDEDIDSIWIYDKKALFKRLNHDEEERLVLKQKQNQDDDEDIM